MQTFTDVLSYRFVLANLVAKEFKTLYRSMALGFLWSLLQPLVLVTVLSVVWIVFFGQERTFASMVLVALIPHNFTVYCLTGCTSAIVRNKTLVQKVRFPRQILPVSVIVTHTVHFAIQGILIVVVLFVFPPEQSPLGWTLLWLPVVVGVHVALVTGVGLLVSALNVVFRDVQYIVESLVTILFWVSPILYPARTLLLDAGAVGVPDWVIVAYYANPLAGLLDAYRSVLFEARAPHPGTFAAAVVVTLLLGIWGVRTFWKHEREFADLV